MIDDQLIAALSNPLTDSSPVELKFRKTVRAERVRAFGFMATAVVSIVLAGVVLLRPDATLAAAARDHQREVVERQPRKWHPNVAEFAQTYRLDAWMSARLAPAGYVLEHAKTCGFEGERVLHLVYSNGTSEFSLFVRPVNSKRLVSNASFDRTNAAAFDRVILVSTFSKAECRQLAERAAGIVN